MKKLSQYNHCQANRKKTADMKAEEIVLIRQALTYHVTILEIRLEDSTIPLCIEIIGKELDRANKALAASLRLI